MKRIRIGKDISIRWEINTDGAAVPLEGRDLTLELKSPIGKVIILPCRVDGNVLTMTYYGYEQTVVGEYSLTLWENKGKQGQNVVDAIRAFKLVRTSPEEADFTGGDLQVESVDLGTANLEILSGGGAATPGESPDLSALEGKVAANTTSISKINAELDTVKEVQGGHNNSIAQIHNTLEEHANSIASNNSSCEENAAEIERVSNVVDAHESRLGNIDATISSHTASLNGINNTLANHDAQIDNAAESIESTNSALSALQGKVDANAISIAQINTKLGEHTDSISELKSSSSLHGTSIDAINAQVHSQGKSIGSIEGKLAEHSESIRQASIAIEENSGSIADIRAKHNSDLDAINDILDEQTQSINATSDIVSGHTSEITSIKNEQTEQNNRLADHEERLVYTESDLVKVREEYNGIISELVFAIDEKIKQAVRGKMCTIDFGQEEDTVSVAIMNANTKIVKVKTQNVAELRITYGTTMQQAVDLSAEVLNIDLGTADFMVIKITRTSDEQGALVGFTFNI